MALTKVDMVDRLIETVPINRKDAKQLVDQFFDEIKGALARGETVKLSGFGNFDLRDKNQRPGRNPKTGQDIPISARRVVTFKSGQKLKSMVETSVSTASKT
jgi:integration host factor subunit alpha